MRLRSAGAVLVGATNVPVDLGDWQSYNPIYATTNNPWDLKRAASAPCHAPCETRRRHSPQRKFSIIIRALVSRLRP